MNDVVGTAASVNASTGLRWPRGSRLAAIAASVSMVVVSGCGMLDSDSLTERALEEVVERATDGELDIDSADGSITLDDGEGGTTTIGMSTDIPAGFADIVPLPPGLEVAGVTEVDEGDGQLGISVVGLVEGSSIDALMGDIDAALSGSGWATPEGAEEVDIYANVPEMDYRLLERGDAVLMLTVMSEDAAVGPHQTSYILVLGEAG